MNLVERDRKHLWHPYTQEKTAPLPVPVIGAKGVWLETEDGRKILDGISSWWVNIHGHSHPSLNAALAKQAGELEHTIFAGFTHKPAIELAEKLVEILPGGLTRVFYSDNGSTAVEVALKMAYQFWDNLGEPRKTFVALTNSYHGDTFGAMAASDESSFTKPFQNLLCKVLRTDGDLGNLENLFRENSAEIAAMIIEPMLQGAGGMIIWKPEFVKGVRELCDKYNVLMIADEVLTGFGRTGKMFACEHAGISPDIICLSKALTAGYMPFGATVANEKIYNAFLSSDRKKTFFHGHSYTANPLACAVAIASLELFKLENSLEKVSKISRKFREYLGKLPEFSSVRNARTLGGLLAFDVASEDSGYLANIGQELYLEFLSRNILLRPLGNVIYFMPPFSISESEIDWAFEEIFDVLNIIEKR